MRFNSFIGEIMEIHKINQTQPNFCALRKTPDVKYYLRRFPEEIGAKIDALGVLNKDVPIDVYVSIKRIKGKNKLIAEVETKTFKENRFRGPVDTVKKALKYASKLATEQKQANQLTKGMSIPKID